MKSILLLILCCLLTFVPSVYAASSAEKFSNTGFETDLTGWDNGAYTLNDQFTTNRSAGAVNGTSAEPTGGTRTVTDTNNVVSITGSLLNFATGGLTTGDPGIWYPTLTRSQGLTMIGSITPSSGTVVWGFDSNQAGNIGSNGLQFTANNLQAFEGASAKPNMGSYVAGTTYSTAVNLRSTGAYYFIKGGTFSDWTLIWSSALQSNTPVFPAANVRINPATFTTDNIRVPSYLWLPTPLAHDTFTTDGATTTETTGPDSQTTPSLSWTNQVGTWTNTSGAAAATALSGGVAARTVPTSSADVMIDVGLTRSGGNGGLVFRYQDTSNYLIAYHDGTNARVDKVVAGTTTNVLTAAATYSAGAVIKVIARGTTVELYYNNVRVGGGVTVTDLSTATIHGLYTTNTGNTLDTFTLWSRTNHAVPDTDLTATRDTATKYAGAASAKLVAPSANDANFTQSVNVGDTSTYNLSVLAYTDGSAITANDLSLYYDTGTINTTFSSVGAGWYQITGTITGVASSKAYGVQVKSGKTVYVDDLSLSVVSTSSDTSTSSSTSSSAAPEIAAGGQGGIITKNNVVSIVPAGTFKWDADLFVTSTSKTGSFKIPGTYYWQVSSVYEIWWKSFFNGAKIFSSDIAKPFILAFQYNLGQIETSLSEKNLRIAYSENGKTNWKILPNSVLDTKNKTVAIVTKNGGYYMLVSRARLTNQSTLGIETEVKLEESIINPSPTVSPTPIANVEPQKNKKQCFLFFCW